MTRMMILVFAVSACGGAGLGPETRADIQAQMQKTQAPIQSCYAAALKSNRKLRGMVTIELTAEPETGQFKDIMIRHDEVQDPSVRNCILTEVAKQKLATPTKSAVLISFPFNFTPSN